MIKITYLRKKCIGCNGCVETAPDRWKISNKDGRSVLIGARLKHDNYQILLESDEYHANKQAATNCPMRIIKVEQLKN